MAELDGRVALVTGGGVGIGRATALAFAREGAKVESQGEEANKVYLERLSLVSRFPQGLSDELLAELLNEMGQDEVEVPHKTD